jgi:hypothetical protein
VTCGRTRGVAQLCRGAGEGDPSLVPTNETCPPPKLVSAFWDETKLRKECGRRAQRADACSAGVEVAGVSPSRPRTPTLASPSSSSSRARAAASPPTPSCCAR